ncbi:MULTISPECIES: hypothetical protein [unclassified Gilliamella]|uniref:hypothetical protein n=1 Tax=unclassified Gilliamella TaxID=2685620 RepID=UPI0005547E94|nr:hypothetical protein [Gilliamella apicola]OCG53994.1 hypothetical protein A9G38_03260 [Gilliamella apicola]OCG58359.1 hypothetical protein A9G40_09790 [Gilliamella apicola]OCG71354.1 hypothetical protein A9G41_02915 [Gilliamella apicola]
MALNPKLPPIPFVKLERAARILDCDVDDFLFWNSEGMIALYAFVNKLECSLCFCAKKKEYNEQCETFIEKFNNVNKIENSIRVLGQFTTNILGRASRYPHPRKYDYLIETPDKIKPDNFPRLFRATYFGKAYGIWRIKRFSHWLQLRQNMRTCGNKKGFTPHEVSIQTLLPMTKIGDMDEIFDYYLKIRGDNEFIFNANELLISTEDIILLQSANNEFLPDLFIDELGLCPSFIRWGDVIDSGENKANVKIMRKPENFYKPFAIETALLTREKFPHCKVVSLSRKILSKIANDFNATNPPTEKTISNWLYEIKIGKPSVTNNNDFELVIPDEWQEFSE